MRITDEDQRNGKIVRSKLPVKMVLLGLLDAGCCFLLGRFLYYGLENSCAGKVYENWWLDFFLPLLFMGMVGLACLVMLFCVLVCFTYRIVVDTSLRTLTAFSLLHPKGVALKLDDYTGYYVRTKTTRAPVDGYIIRGRQEVCCLVDGQKRARQIMSSMAYRNYGQLKEALGLPEVTEQGIPLVFGGQAEDREGAKKRNM